jgi:enolase
MNSTISNAAVTTTEYALPTKEEIVHFLQVAAVEEYSRRHNLKAKDTLALFEQYNLLNIIEEEYEVLHTQDPDETCDFAEDYIESRRNG